MKTSIFKSNSLLKIIYNSLINLPTPLNINIWWNFGSLLGLMLMIQIISGLILSMHYCPNTSLAFKSMIHIIQDMNNGWIFRNIHMNGASMFFILMYIHIGRNIYYNNYTSMNTWFSGIMIFLISMITAFMGYVLPWGQMSFWGATVITNLISTIPYIGTTLVYWLWGDFYVSNSTLNRFFSLHFILPLIIFMMMIIHLLFLHNYGSSNPLGISNKMIMIPFHPYFTIKDILGIWILIIIILMISLFNPYLFNDPENFNEANSMITPIHIQPEWYFLFAYAILRSIPNKLGGVIALMMSILILFILPLTFNFKIKSFKFNYMNQILFWNFISLFVILTWIGAKPVEYPYIFIGQIMSVLYFMYFIFFPFLNKFNDMFIFK